MDSILNTIRNYQNKPSEMFSSGAALFLLFILFIAGYYIFFISFSKLRNTYTDISFNGVMNHIPVLSYIRFPVMFIYIILFSYILFFLFKRWKLNNPLYNLSFELTTHTFTFGKMLLLLISIFGVFYLMYQLILSILIKSIKFSVWFTLILIVIILAIINSYTQMYDTDTPNEYIDFIKDLIFYIPCLLSDFIDYAKKDYKDTPNTVFILFVLLVVVCFIYLGVYCIKFKNPLLLIDSPVYLNTSIISYNRTQFVNIIIESRPWYQRELLKSQNPDIISSIKSDISFNTFFKNINNYVEKLEPFTSVISKELMPIHLNITEYDKYILKQAMYNDSEIRNQVYNASNNQQIINMIIEKQKNIIGYYEWFLMYLAYLNSNNLSKYVLGDLYTNTYHYGISFWIYLNSNVSLSGKDIIFKYGSKPSMYYNQNKKELTLEMGDSVVLYATNNILYQRWNHIVMNYNYGTFDLFINNNLVGTYTNIVNYTNSDELFQVGFTSNNNLGGIAKFLYSEEPLQLHTIENLYQNPPNF